MMRNNSKNALKDTNPIKSELSKIAKDELNFSNLKYYETLWFIDELYVAKTGKVLGVSTSNYNYGGRLLIQLDIGIEIARSYELTKLFRNKNDAINNKISELRDIRDRRYELSRFDEVETIENIISFLNSQKDKIISNKKGVNK